jgi:hypothetical protein
MTKAPEEESGHSRGPVHSHTPGHKHEKLPITAEVGGEGGSYADPTNQVATFEGDVPKVNDVTSDAVEPDIIQSDTMRGTSKYPSDR